MSFQQENFRELLKNPDLFAQWLESITVVSLRIPTDGEADALEGEGGTPSSANKYVVASFPALAGTYGTPGSGNEFVTNTDPRLTITVASMGTFTMDNAATMDINDTAVSASCGIMLQPINQAAGTLQGSAKCLIVDDADFVVATSFTVKTADGNAAVGTEDFRYWIFD